MKKFLIIFIISIICGIFGRLGGAEKKNDKWDFIRRTWIRDWIIPFIYLIIGWFYGWHWSLIICYFAMAGALTTYWDDLFGYDCYWFAGLVVGLSSVFYKLFTIKEFWIKAIIISFIWYLVNKYSRKIWKWDRAQVAEFLRYSLTAFIIMF